MPAKSEKQAIAARIARGIQKGEVKPKAGTASAEMAKMPASSLKHFTKTEAKASGGLSDPTNLEKLVKVLAKKVEDFQNYVGVDAPYDASIDTLESEIENLKNPKISKFWNDLSSQQQDELHYMVTTYLLNKAIKADPDAFGDETPQKIVYKLPEKPKVPAGVQNMGMDKLVKYLAKASADHMNYVGLDSPEQIMFNEFEDVIDNDKNPKIKKIWNSMKSGQQEDLYEKVVAVLEKKYGDGDDEMYESSKLGEMVKEMNLEKEPPSPPTKDRFAWEDDPYHSRRFEKSDVSWREYDEMMNPQNYR
jgi:hypothetical protein